MTRGQGTAAPRKSARGRLLELVGAQASQLLDNAEAVSPDELSDAVCAAQPRLVDEAGRAEAAKIVKAMSRSVLRRRSDSHLQGELDLGIPDGWTLRCRRGDGSAYYVLAKDASEDDLVAAEEERKHAIKLAEAAVANAGQAGQRKLNRARADLDRLHVFMQRLADAAA